MLNMIRISIDEDIERVLEFINRRGADLLRD